MSSSNTNSYFLSSLTKKYFMALSGLFLCLFLVGHLAGNLQLFMQGEAARLQFNKYGEFMTSFPLVKILSYLTYFSIIFHVIDGLMLTLHNRKARPVGYAYSRPDKNSAWSSRNMGILGTVLLIFIVLHMKSFWAEVHFGALPEDANHNKDLYFITVAAFKQWWYTALYIPAMAALGFHLYHGFASGFQSLGLRHPRYYSFIRKFGMGFSIVVPFLFGAICVYLFVLSNYTDLLITIPN